METLGVWLRQTREAKGETLRDAEAATRIRVRFLEMLEESEFAALPGGEVQARGFLRIYARHLGLSADEVLTRFKKETRSVEPILTETAEESRPAPPARPAAEPAPSASPAPPRWMSLETLIVVGIIIIALLVIVIGVIYLMSRGSAGEESNTPPPITTSTRITPPTTAAGTGVKATKTPPPVTPTFPVSPAGDVTLKLEATEHVWVRVTVDGVITLEGTIAPGQKSWSGQETIVVDTGNGAGLLATVNGQQQGAVGARNQVSCRAWGPNGEIAAP